MPPKRKESLMSIFGKRKPRAQNKIEIIVKGGAIQKITNLPKNVCVVVKDFDNFDNPKGFSEDIWTNRNDNIPVLSLAKIH